MGKLLHLLTAASLALSAAFLPPPLYNVRTVHCRTSCVASMAPTIVEPKPPTETERRKRRIPNIMPPDQGEVRGPLEWLIDDHEITREADDPFHILLLDDTFRKNPRMTIEYVASSCSYVLGMPYDDAAELARHAKNEGFSCLGTWSHEECLRLGRLLQQRDLVCRVVPFCEGGDRPWQARDANAGDEALKRAEDGVR